MQPQYLPAMLKSKVKQHTRRTKSGKVVAVREHQTAKTSAAKEREDRLKVEEHMKQRLHHYAEADRYEYGSDEHLHHTGRAMEHRTAAEKISMKYAKKSMEATMDMSKFPLMQKAMVGAGRIAITGPNLDKYPHLKKAIGTQALSKALEFSKTGKEIIVAIHTKIGACQFKLVAMQADHRVKIAEGKVEDSKYTDKMEPTGEATPESPTEEIPWKIKNEIRKINDLRRVANNIKPSNQYKLSEYDLEQYGF